MTAGQRDAVKVLQLLGEAQERLEAAKTLALRASFSAADLEAVLGAEQHLVQLKTDAVEFRRALRLTVHTLVGAVRSKTGSWPALPDGSIVRADRDSPRWSFAAGEDAQRFLDAVTERLTELAPADGVVAWAVRRLAEVYPLHTRSIPVTHSGAEALGVDPTKYRESTEGARDYKVVAPKTLKGGK